LSGKYEEVFYCGSQLNTIAALRLKKVLNVASGYTSAPFPARASHPRSCALPRYETSLLLPDLNYEHKW
jgi:hypothetical protein